MKGRRMGSFKYKHPFDNAPIGVYEYRSIMRFLKLDKKEVSKQYTPLKRGKPCGTIKHKNELGKPIGVYEWRRTEQGKKSKYFCEVKRKYNINEEYYNNLLKNQNNSCAICKTPFIDFSRRNLHLDHNHKNNKVRGILCIYCNNLLGLAKEDINILSNAIEYIKRCP